MMSRRPLSEAGGLLGGEGSIVEIVEAHGAAYFRHGLCSCLAGGLGAAAQDVDDGRDVLCELGTALTDGLEGLLQNGGEELLHLHIAETAATVVVLEGVEVLVVGQVAAEVLGAAESIEVGEDRVAFDLTGVADAQMVGIGEHGLDFLLDLVGRVLEVDAVAEALGHLGLTVGAGQAQAGCVLGQENIGFDERLAVDVVEAADDLAALLEHRLLILAHGHGSGLEEGDVGSLGDGIGEEAYGDALARETTHLNLGLHRRVALEAADADEVHEVEGELAEFGNLALDEEGALLRVEAYGEVVECHFDDVLTDLVGVVDIIGEGLSIGLEDEDLVVETGVLQFDAATERANVVADVEGACGAVAGEDDFLLHEGIFL